MQPCAKPTPVRLLLCLLAGLVSYVLVQVSLPNYGPQALRLLTCFYLPLGALCVWQVIFYVRSNRGRRSALIARLRVEEEEARRLCIAAIEALAGAVEARSAANLGHLERVQAYSVAIARRMRLSADEAEGIGVAALLHEIGQLGVPENILIKGGELSESESERLRLYPALGGRILSTVPFPWPVVTLVRHHREHFDGSGYPDGLKEEAIPLGARIIAVADTYDSLTSDRSFRSAFSHEEAKRILSEGAGSRFDPEVLKALFAVVGATRAELSKRSASRSRASASFEIARAHLEVQALYDMACAVGSTLQIETLLQTLAHRIQSIIPNATCAIFLVEEGGQVLRCHAAYGTNEEYLRGSTARVGAYLTGRSVSRGEAVRASFLAQDLQLADADDIWIPLRSTLSVPIRAGSECTGTINLYHTEPDAFTSDDARVMLVVGELAGRALQNARLFARSQDEAMTDPLTGLRNARCLRQFLQQELNRARTTCRPLSILGIDLDYFKQINDTLGHVAGDRVLQAVARAISGALRNYDLAVRYAGDEFAVVLPDTDREQANAAAERIRQAVLRNTPEIAEAMKAAPNFGISVGIATFPTDAQDCEGLIGFSDRAMYEDKRRRRAA